MSVINQVLQDLEKRGAPVTHDHTDAVVSQVRAVPMRQVPASGWLYALVLLGLLAVAGGWFLLNTPHRVSAPVVVSSQSSTPVQSVNPSSPSNLPIPPTPTQVVDTMETAPVVAATVSSPTTPAAAATSVLPLSLSLKLGDMHPPKAVAITSQEAPARAEKPKPVTAAASALKAGVEAVTPAIPVTPPPNKTVVVKSPASTSAPVGPTVDGKQIKQVSPQQRAEHEFRKAVALMHQGRINEALDGYGAALQYDASYEAARQAMVGLLIENKRSGEAERILQEGVRLNPRQTGFVMILSRIQMERGDAAAALDTLQKSLSHAINQAEYRAFMGALLQRQSRHKEAAEHYRAAVSLTPGSGVWLMGLGISLQADGQTTEAHDAFLRAKETRNLNADLQAFVDQRIKQTAK